MYKRDVGFAILGIFLGVFLIVFLELSTHKITTRISVVSPGMECKMESLSSGTHNIECYKK